MGRTAPTWLTVMGSLCIECAESRTGPAHPEHYLGVDETPHDGRLLLAPQNSGGDKQTPSADNDHDNKLQR